MTNWQQISSDSNRRFKAWLQLLESRGIRSQSRFLVAGRKTIVEALRDHTGEIEAIIICKAHRPQIEDLLHHAKSAISVFELTVPLFRKLNTLGVDSPYLVCRLPNISAWEPKPKEGGLQLLCPLGNPLNVGNLVRTAAAFKVDAFVLLQESAFPFHPKAVRAASGGIWNLRFFQGPSIHELPGLPIQGITLDIQGCDLTAHQWDRHSIALVGEEGPGVPPSLKDWTKVTITQATNVESLNAPTAAAIALFTYRTQYPLSATRGLARG